VKFNTQCCSECDRRFTLYLDDEELVEADFCPFCRAEMLPPDEEEQERHYEDE
jgi:hypothetical protein